MLWTGEDLWVMPDGEVRITGSLKKMCAATEPTGKEE